MTITSANCRLAAAALLLLSGCASKQAPSFELANYAAVATQLEYPDLCEQVRPLDVAVPLTIDDLDQAEYWDLSLEQAIQLALQHSKIMRDLGGRVLTLPDSARSIYGPALMETDPRFGVEAALSAFDAWLEASAIFENNDRAINNQFLGGGTRLLKQDLGNYRAALSKRTATGGEFSLRHTWDYDANNAPGNAFNSAWTVLMDAEFRQPLLQRGGQEFNRVYGPEGTPGLARGVLVARVNTDISLAEFQISLRNLISDVENCYWELHFAYRDLGSKRAAQERALKTWRIIRDNSGRRGFEADKEAAAREQFYRLQADVQEALAGRVPEPTQSNAVRGNGGVQAQERRLRLLMGVPINDRRLIRPVDDPSLAAVTFNWPELVAEAMDANAELRRQRWKLQRQELVLHASRNFMLPELDVLGRYRWRGFGKDLLDPGGQDMPFDNAYANLTEGGFQEWQLGVEMKLPVGFRQGAVTYRNAMILVARERALLEEQQRHVLHQLSAWLAEMERAHQISQTHYNRVVAANDQLRALETNAADAEPNQQARLIDQILRTQRTLADAESQFYRSVIEYAVATKNVHLFKGSLLGFNGVQLAEGLWPEKAYHDAAEKTHLQLERPLQHVHAGPVVSGGQAWPGMQLLEAPAVPHAADSGSQLPPAPELDQPTEAASLPPLDEKEGNSMSSPSEAKRPVPAETVLGSPLRGSGEIGEAASGPSLLPRPRTVQPRRVPARPRPQLIKPQLTKPPLPRAARRRQKSRPALPPEPLFDPIDDLYRP